MLLPNRRIVTLWPLPWFASRVVWLMCSFIRRSRSTSSCGGARRGIPVIVVAGRILVTPEELAHHGVVAAAQLLDVAPSPQDAMGNAAKYLARATSQVLEGA